MFLSRAARLFFFAALSGLPWAGLALAGVAMQADLHLDTLTGCYTKGLTLDAASGLEASLPLLRAGGTNVAVFALWPPRNVNHPARVDALLDLYEREDARLDGLALAHSADEARDIVGAGRVAAVISLEGAHGLAEDWRADLDQLYGRGLRMLGLTWSFSNRFAGSSSDGGGGLTEEGRALVTRAQELGVLVDVSHASRRTTLDVCAVSKAPVVASHSDAHALAGRERNLSDEEIRCIAATGGVIGLNLHATFLGGTQDLAQAVRQLTYLRDVGGDGVVALGSDYDGLIHTPTGLPDAGTLPRLWAALRTQGWDDAQIAGVRGENFMRAWSAAQKSVP